MTLVNADKGEEMEVDASFGPPVEADGEDRWRTDVRWWRPFICECGYEGREYWNRDMENTLVCTKCGNGRRTPPEEGES